MFVIYQISHDFIFPIEVEKLTGKMDWEAAMQACHRHALEYQRELLDEGKPLSEAGQIRMINENKMKCGYVWEKPDGGWIRVVAVLVSLSNV